MRFSLQGKPGQSMFQRKTVAQRVSKYSYWLHLVVCTLMWRYSCVGQLSLSLLVDVSMVESGERLSGDCCSLMDWEEQERSTVRRGVLDLIFFFSTRGSMLWCLKRSLDSHFNCTSGLAARGIICATMTSNNSSMFESPWLFFKPCCCSSKTIWIYIFS